VFNLKTHDYFIVDSWIGSFKGEILEFAFIPDRNYFLLFSYSTQLYGLKADRSGPDTKYTVKIEYKDLSNGKIYS
jgi:hypothetical protein